ncbi:MAG: VCBS repeat-containing protein [Acidobacteria bacterium]|nr:VCBS repeat-containing protein [Acidobacteriota bacterium]
MVVPGDYDGDGKTDIAVVREGATENSALTWFIRQSSNGGLRSAAFGSTGGALVAGDITAQNDYDGDGKTDIAVWRDATGVFYILRSTDGGLTSAQWGASGDFPIASHDTH